MDIIFRSQKFEKEYRNFKLLQKRHGAQRAKLLIQRVAELKAAAALEILRTLPAPRCHELKGNRAGQLSVDLDGPYRLIFKPDHNPIPTKSEGGLDWTKVDKIEIIGVEDTHE